MGIESATLAQIGLGMQIGGAVGGTVAAYDKAASEKQAYLYRAAVSSNNAQYATWQAEDAIARGQTDRARAQIKGMQLKGTQVSRMAAAGLDLGEGSALNILTDTDLMTALDANTIRDNAQREAWGYRAQASNSNSEAGVLRSRADRISPTGSAFSTLLTGAGAVASSWYSADTKGVFSKKKDVPISDSWIDF